MIFKPGIWRPIAIVLTVVNVAGAGYAIASVEPVHAAIHTALALAFGLWAQRLRRGSGGSERQAGLDAVEADVARLRQEVSEMQERLDFTERLLAQRPDPGRAGPQR